MNQNSQRFIILLLLILFFKTFGYSQQMQDGFDYLEGGKFAQAEVFFEDILKEFPDNKTARLCYGRAVGLNADPDKAIGIFQSLLDESPDNLEVKLNLAESYLWNKDYQTALPFYETLVDNNPTNITALIGLGNTHSLLSNNEAAEPYLTKVLQLDPSNQSAQQSLQYVRLGLAQTEINRDEMESAKKILESNLDLPVDLTPTYLNLANLSIITQSYSQSERYYLKVLELNPNSLSAYQGLTTVYHLQDKKKKRNLNAKKVKALIDKDETPDATVTDNNYSQYVQSLIWDHQYETATNLIKVSKQKQLLSEINSRILYARMQSQLQNHKKALNLYNGIINKDNYNIESWIGRTQTLIAMDSMDVAHSTLNLALQKHPDNLVLNEIALSLKRKDLPEIVVDSYYNSDSGGDNALNGKCQLAIPISKKISLLTSYQQRTTFRENINTSANHRFGLIGIDYRIKPNFKITVQGGYSQVNQITQYGKPILSLSAQTKIKRQYITIGYQNLYQDYNTNLLTQGFIQNRFFAKYNVSNHRGLGLYTEFNQSFLSDLNRSSSIFISGYKSIKRRPFIKLGINIQGLTFNQQRETFYFSPSSFVGTELFVDLVRSEDMFKGKGVTYLLTAAGGFQRVTGETEPTYRFQSSLGYRFESGVNCGVYGVISNIAANTVSGFRYTSVGFKITSYLSRQPLFTRG